MRLMTLFSRVGLALVAALVATSVYAVGSRIAATPVIYNAEQLYDRYSASIASIKVKAGAREGHGTAFYVGGNLWASAGHVAVGGDTFSINGHPAVPYRVDSMYDVALFVSEPPLAGEALQLCAAAPAIGSEVVIIGYPLNLGTGPTVARGVVGSYQNIRARIFDVIASMSIYPGDSGSPVFAPTGCVVGVAIYGIINTSLGRPEFADGLAGIAFASHLLDLMPKTHTDVE